MKTPSFACLIILWSSPMSSLAQLRAVRGASRAEDHSSATRTLQNNDEQQPDQVHYAIGIEGGSGFGSKTTGEGLYAYSSSNAGEEGETFSVENATSASTTSSSQVPSNGVVNMDEVVGGSGFGSTTTGGGLYTFESANAGELLEVFASATSAPATTIYTPGGAGYMNTVISRAPYLTRRPNQSTIPTRRPIQSTIPTRRPSQSTIPTRRPTQKPVETPAPTRQPTRKAVITKYPSSQPIPSPVVDTNLSGLAAAWVVAHNIRREYLHATASKPFVAVKWSDSLAISAQNYAEQLLSFSSQCAITHGYNGDSYGGENIAANWGYGSYQYSRSRTPEEVLQAWFEDEMGRPFGANGHYTQVGWRATKYIGCGMASKVFGSGSTCNIQVCRYLKPGNCNVNSGNWYSNMMADESWCDPPCPKEGCF